MLLKLKSLFFLSLLIFNVESLFSQLQIGEWQDYFSYNTVTSVSRFENLVYCTSDNGIFTLNPENNEIEKLLKTDGFSENAVKFAVNNENRSTLIIIYQNSNIDVLKSGRVFNFPDIMKKQGLSDKAINNIRFYGDTAYLACGFGIVQFNAEKLEFGDTWFIGQNSGEVKVFDFFKDNSFYYAATEQGVLKADKSNPFLYANWKKITEIPNPDFAVLSMLSENGNFYVNQLQNDGSKRVYMQNNGVWNLTDMPTDLVNLKSENNSIIAYSKQAIYFFRNGQNYKTINQYNFPDTTVSEININAVESLTDEILIIGDKKFGVVKYNLTTDDAEYFYPEGPITNSFGQATIVGNKTYFTAGGFAGTLTGFFREPVYSVIDGNSVQSFAVPECWHDAYCIAPVRGSNNSIYLGAWGQGIYELENNTLKNFYDDTNTSMLDISGLDGYIRVSSMQYDKTGNLWISTSQSAKPITVKTSDNQWYSYNFNGNLNEKETGQLLVTSSGNIWGQIYRGGGLFAFNPNGTTNTDIDDDYRRFSLYTPEGDLISNQVNCLVEDKNNEIWVGTDAGVAVFPYPDGVFSGENFYADHIQLTSYGNDTTEQYLLFTENVTKIAVDGGNRKWIGTANTGLYLVSPDGKTELAHFDYTNSILPSNNIVDIDIHPSTGVVYIGTDKGLVSCRGEAIEGKTSYDNVYVFPNPVRENFTGPITITGLMSDTNVKITDINGNLVYETTSLGGQAVWNGSKLNGEKASSGVYLVFCSNSDGSSKMVEKLLLMR